MDSDVSVSGSEYAVKLDPLFVEISVEPVL